MSKALPSGTVTLLFTDIEGSSRLWDEHRTDMAAALTRHNELLRLAIEAAAGAVVKDKGDGFFAVFHTATDALQAAVAAQRAIRATHWPESTGALKVRMAVHTGSVTPEGGDYRGPAVNRVARLEGLGHGGQILVSESTKALVEDLMPADANLEDLGSHLLRGMSRPERVYQLVAPDLPAVFPALRTDIGGGVELPTYPTSFVGRANEMEAIDSLLASGETRLVTLLGPGGIGKTRLAVETARVAGSTLRGRAYFADLAPLSNPSDVGLAIAEAVGAHTEGSASPVALAASRITEPTLVVLDNFEHVTDAAVTVAELLDATSELRLLATSRTPLNVRGERIFHIEPLSSANGDGSTPPALALLYERAASFGVTIADEGPDRESALAITKRLDGLPLAIELVAARTRIVGIAELAELLDESLDALGAGSADMPDRQRTIRSTIEWSLQGLTQQQRALFAHASIFPEGSTLAQLGAIEPEVSKTELLESITALVDNSLINVVTEQPGATRYRQLVVLRDYGRKRLVAEGTYDETMSRLVDYYVDAAPALSRRLQQSDEVHRELAPDHANLLAAMDWSIAGGRVSEMVDVTCSLWVYWFNGDLARSGWEWLEAVRPHLQSAKVEWLTGFLALQSGDAETAILKLTAAKEMFVAAGDDEWSARAGAFMSFLAEDPVEGGAWASEAVEFFSDGEPGVDLFLARLMQSSFYFRTGDLDTAIDIRRSLLEWGQNLFFSTMIAWGHWNLGLALLAAGQVEEAREHNDAAVGTMLQEGYQEGVASAADIEAAIRLRSDDYESGLRILGGADRVWDTIGAVRWPEAGLLVEQALAEVSDRIGADAASEKIAAGHDLTLEQLAALALDH